MGFVVILFECNSRENIAAVHGVFDSMRQAENYAHKVKAELFDLHDRFRIVINPLVKLEL